MYSRKRGAVYKLHVGWFTNRILGEFVTQGLLTKSEGLLCEDLAERGLSSKLPSDSK